MKKQLLACTLIFGRIGLLCASVMEPDGKKEKLDDLNNYTILLPSIPTEQEQTGAVMLSDYLKRATGVKLNLVQTPAQVKGKAISIGRTELAAKNGMEENSREQGYRITLQDGNLYILGGMRGPIYGVMAFLEEDLGIRWFDRFEEPYIPELSPDTLSVVSRSYAPPFEIREPLRVPPPNPVKKGDYKGWLTFNRIQALSYFSNIPEAQGGGLSNVHFFIHTYDQLVPAKKYYKSHPEYFPVIGGKRHKSSQHDGQLCYTSDGVAEIMAEALDKAIEKMPGSRVYSVSANDNQNSNCECPKCSELIKTDGIPGAQLFLANRVAERLAEKYPEIKITTLAYVASQTPPPNVKPSPNTVPIYAPIRQRFNSFELLPWKDVPQIMKELKRWGEVSEHLYVWDYIYRATVPYPHFDVVEANIRTWLDHNVTGIFLETSEFSLNSLAPLKTWVFAKMFWNPDWDMNALIEEFIRGYYGPAASEMSQYVAFQRNKWREVYRNRKAGDDIRFSKTDNETMRKLLKLAYGKAGKDTVLQNRIAEEIASFGVMTLNVCTKKNLLQYEKDLAWVGNLIRKHKIEVGRVKSGDILKKWADQLTEVKNGSNYPVYCEDSILLTEKGVHLPQTKLINDKKALTGKAARQTMKNDWAVQWDFQKFHEQAALHQVYVVRLRLRGEFNKKHNPEGNACSLHLWRSGITGTQGRYIKYKELKKDSYNFVYPFKLYVYSPAVSGYFYNCIGADIGKGEAVRYDYLEFIPLEQFKDKRLAASLPQVTL